MQPSFKYNLENLEIVSKFFSQIKLLNDNQKAVIEYRDPSWWKAIDKIENIGLVFCSVDAPFVIELSQINQYILEYMVIENGIDISIHKENLIPYQHQLEKQVQIGKQYI